MWWWCGASTSSSKDPTSTPRIRKGKKGRRPACLCSLRSKVTGYCRRCGECRAAGYCTGNCGSGFEALTGDVTTRPALALWSDAERFLHLCSCNGCAVYCGRCTGVPRRKIDPEGYTRRGSWDVRAGLRSGVGGLHQCWGLVDWLIVSRCKMTPLGGVKIWNGLC